MRGTALLRRLIGFGLVWFGALCCAGGALAQSYPVRPIRLIVPFPPSGPNDLFARLAGQMLQESLGQQIIIDNRGGAAGSIGAEAVAKAPPDGYTLLFAGAAVLSTNPAMNPRLPYDALLDFSPVSQIATAPSVLLRHPALPAATVKELIALAKAKPGRLNYASAGNGTNPHLAGELFKVMTGTDIVHVPYKGGGPATTDLIAGQVQLYFAGISAAVPFVKQDRVRAIAVTGAARSPQLPTTPTFAESGLEGYDVSNWYAVLAPRGTPAAVIDALNAAISRGLGSADMRRRIAELGAVPAGSSPAQLGAKMRTEIEKWTKVVRDAKLEVE